MIYLKLKGRLGNQLFMYAAARSIQKRWGDDQEIVIEDCGCLSEGFENLLPNYSLKNVRYIHDLKFVKSRHFILQLWIARVIKLLQMNMNARQIYDFDVKYQRIYNHLGLVRVIDGYIPLSIDKIKNVYMYGYFQCEKYFMDIREELKNIFRLEELIDGSEYPGLDLIKERNTVCISVKVECNIGDDMYGVCSSDYHRKAMRIIRDRVEAPLFFICSDDPQYVVDNLISTDDVDYIIQDQSFPAHITLGVMALCKHFIITNSSFAWWAQYLGDHEDKIVIAPSRWYAMDIPCDLYQNQW